MALEDLALQFGGGTTQDVRDTVDIPLQSGWNLLGTPFNFPVAWTDIEAATGDIMINAIDDQGRTATVFQPFEGYWVYREPGVSDLRVPNVATEATARLAVSSRPTVEDWRIRLSANSGRWTDDVNELGVALGAVDGRDRFEVRESPRVVGDLSVCFPHPDWGDYAGSYSADIRAPTDSGAVWDLTVVGGETYVTVQMDTLTSLPPGFSARLLSTQTRQIVGVDEELLFSIGGGTITLRPSWVLQRSWMLSSGGGFQTG